jgi:hypothetical protein
MNRTPKPLSTRKPPEPSESHEAIDDWMKRGMPDLLPIVRHLDELIRDLLPDPQFAVKWKKAYYGTPKHGWVIEIASYDVSANVVFLKGEQLNPRPPLGSGESRYVKITSLKEAEDPDLRKWIEQAASVPGWQ